MYLEQEFDESIANKNLYALLQALDARESKNVFSLKRNENPLFMYDLVTGYKPYIWFLKNEKKDVIGSIVISKSDLNIENTTKKVFYLNDFIINPNYQGQGLSRYVMHKLAGYFKDTIGANLIYACEENEGVFSDCDECVADSGYRFNTLQFTKRYDFYLQKEKDLELSYEYSCANLQDLKKESLLELISLGLPHDHINILRPRLCLALIHRILKYDPKAKLFYLRQGKVIKAYLIALDLSSLRKLYWTGKSFYQFEKVIRSQALDRDNLKKGPTNVCYLSLESAVCKDSMTNLIKYSYNELMKRGYHLMLASDLIMNDEFDINDLVITKKNVIFYFNNEDFLNNATSYDALFKKDQKLDIIFI